MDNSKILKLRMKGYGYKKIATELGISINTVKSYCRRHNVQAKQDKCEMCSATIEHTAGARKKRFCGDKCRYAWWNAQRTAVNGSFSTQCLYCGKEILSFKSKNRKYCSRECYAKARVKNV